MEHLTAIDKALEVLFHLRDQHEPQGVSEIGRALGLPKSSAHRLLAALRRRELVEQDEAGRYRPGAGLLGLALSVLDREPLVAAARPTLEQHALALGETFFLVSARGGRLIVLDKVEGTGVLRVSPQVGSAVPVHASAVGKLYLAHPSELVSLPRPLPRYTPHTITSVLVLMQQVQAVGAQGHALSRGEWIEGLTVVAAPLFRERRMLGAVCVAIAAAGKRADERRVIGAVERAAASISARLGGEA